MNVLGCTTIQFWKEVLLATAIIYIIKYYFDRWRTFTLGNKIPGPKCWPIIGNTFEFLEHDLDLLGKFREYNRKYGFCRFWLGPYLHTILCTPEDAAIFCTSTALLDRTYHFNFFKPLLGDGLLTANGPDWKKAKEVMEPAFKYSSIKSYVPTVQKKSDVLIECLKKEVGKPEFSFLDYMRNCSLDIIVESTIGFSLNAQSTHIEVLEHVEELMTQMWNRIYSVWQQVDILYRLSPTGKDFYRRAKLALDFVDEKIAIFKKSYYEKKEMLKEQPNIKGSPGKIFIETLTSDGWTDDEIRQHAVTMIAVGFDTTSGAVCFIMMMLGMHKDVQEKAYQEVSKLSKDFNDVDVMKLEYLDRVIKETLRLFPTAPITMRKATEDIQFTKYVVPKESAVFINIFAIHRDPKQYENPDVFNPDNFLPENVSKRHPYAYIPFLVGRRKCVAGKFAILSMKIIVAKLLLNFKIECDLKLKDLELRDALTLKTKSAYYPIRLLSR